MSGGKGKRKPRTAKLQRWEHCSPCGKRGYYSENAARRTVRNGGGVRVYRCPHHPKRWHVTASDGTQRSTSRGKPPRRKRK